MTNQISKAREELDEAQRAITGADLSGIPVDLAKRIVTLKKWSQDVCHILSTLTTVDAGRLGEAINKMSRGEFYDGDCIEQAARTLHGIIGEK